MGRDISPSPSTPRLTTTEIPPFKNTPGRTGRFFACWIPTTAVGRLNIILSLEFGYTVKSNRYDVCWNINDLSGNNHSLNNPMLIQSATESKFKTYHVVWWSNFGYLRNRNFHEYNYSFVCVRGYKVPKRFSFEMLTLRTFAIYEVLFEYSRYSNRYIS